MRVSIIQDMNILIDAKKLAARLNHENLLLIDTRPFAKYCQGHIPGAVNIDLFQFHWIDTSKSGIEEFERQTKILLSNIGVKDDNQVVFYDDVSGMTSARGVWLLLYFSHKNVSLLDGGYERWLKEMYPIETKTNPFVHSQFAGKPNREILATFDKVKQSLRKKDSTIIDARTQEEFAGLHIRAARAGHIPTAINVDWQKNIENGSFKSREKLSKLYSKVPQNSTVITYCQGGYRAANTFLALKHLGYKDVKMYLGSWGEWGNKIKFPVEI